MIMNYKKRTVESAISELFDVFPIVVITGPRQAGKSTMIKHFINPGWKYYSLDNRELLLRIKSDPTLFVNSIHSHVAIDEAQKCPELFHALKELVDKGFNYQIILSGSTNFLLMKSITESLAGRVGLLELLPFSFGELLGVESNGLVQEICNSRDIEDLFARLNRIKNQKQTVSNDMLVDFIYKGGLPRIHELKSAPARLRWFQNYVSTYIERDLRDLTQVADLDLFQRVYKLIAYQNGGMINMSTVASDAGATAHTVKRYISILETSYQCKRLPSYHYNQRKQIIKTPKIYYLDSGMVNYFMQHTTVERMLYGGSWGSMLETHVFSELYKEFKDMAPKPSLYYWRTNNGAEVDFIIEYQNRLIPLEVKSSIQIKSTSIRGLTSFCESQAEGRVPFSLVIYRGDEIAYINKTTLAIPVGLLY